MSPPTPPGAQPPAATPPAAPPATPPGARPPDAAPGANVTTGCAACAARNPCDVAMLAVTTRTPPVRVETTERLRGRPLTDRLRRLHTEVRDYDTYDLIIECIASYPHQESTDPPKYASILGETRWEPTCSNGRTHEIELTAIAHRENGLPKKHATRVEQTQILAAATDLDRDRGPSGSQTSKLAQLFAVLFATARLVLGERGSDKQFRVLAKSCGVRPGGASPNGELSALVTVYRKLSVSIKLTIPARRSTTWTRGTTPSIVRPGQPALEYSTRETINRSAGTRVTDIRGGIPDPASRPANASPTSPRPLVDVIRNPALGSSTPPLESVSQLSSYRNDVGLEIKVNDRALDGSATLQQFLGKIKDVEDMISDFAEYIRKAPQVGWRLTWSVEVLFGTIELKLERQESTEIVDRRLLPAKLHLVLTGELTVLKLTLDLSFGFRSPDASWGEVTAAIGLKITGEAKGRFALDGMAGELSANAKAEIIGELSGELYATGTVRVALVGSATARLSATTGITVSLVIYDSLRGGLNPSANVKLKKGAGTVTASAGPLSYSWGGELWPERTLFDSAAPAAPGAQPAQPRAAATPPPADDFPMPMYAWGA